MLKKREELRVINCFPLKSGKCSDEYRKYLFQNEEGRVAIILLDFKGEN